LDKINNTGGLWRNNYKKDGDRRPDYIGEITIAGVTHKIAAWSSGAGGGKPAINIRVTQAVFTPPDKSSTEFSETPAKVVAVEFDPLNPPDEDIPF